MLAKCSDRGWSIHIQKLATGTQAGCRYPHKHALLTLQLWTGTWVVTWSVTPHTFRANSMNGVCWVTWPDTSLCVRATTCACKLHLQQTRDHSSELNLRQTPTTSHLWQLSKQTWQLPWPRGHGASPWAAATRSYGGASHRNTACPHQHCKGAHESPECPRLASTTAFMSSLYLQGAGKGYQFCYSISG